MEVEFKHSDFIPTHTTSSSIDDSELEQRVELYGLCKECQHPKLNEEWCSKCNNERFEARFGTWTSGNKDIDKFISTVQVTATNYSQILEWIPWKRLMEIIHIGIGRFGSAYSVTWLDGYITHWNHTKQEWGRSESGKKFYVKVLQGLSADFATFVNELLSHQNGKNGLIRCYGITQDPATNDYALVIRCIERDMKSYLYSSLPYPEYDWKTKLEILADIALVLHRIHDAGFVHKNLHTGNLRRLMNSTILTEINLSNHDDDSQMLSQPDGIYGVLPYIAPEVLRGGPINKSADVYSLGVIMWEVAVQRPPFDLNAHDKLLAQRICCGLRPHINNSMPKSLAKLIKRCWDANPLNRPEAEEVYIWVQWWLELCNDSTSDIVAEFNIVEGERKQKDGNFFTHPEAVYTKRLLDFPSLPEPENFSPNTYHQMVSSCARLQHTSDSDNHWNINGNSDIFDFESQLSRPPSIYAIYAENIKDNQILTPPPHKVTRDFSLEYSIPGAFIGDDNIEVIDNWDDVEVYIHYVVMILIPNAFTIIFPDITKHYKSLPFYIRISFLSLMFYSIFASIWSLIRLFLLFLFLY